MPLLRPNQRLIVPLAWLFGQSDRVKEQRETIGAAPKSLMGIQPLGKKEYIPTGRKEDEAFYAKIRRRRRRTEIAKESRRRNW